MAQARPRTAEIDLAALLEALAELAPRADDERRAIASLLGFDWRVAAAERSEVAPESPAPVPPAASRLPKLPPPAARGGRPEGYEPALVQPSITSSDPVESLLDEAATKDEPLARTDSKTHLAPPEHVPLVTPGWYRGVFSALLASEEPSTEIDWGLVERALLTGQPLLTLPWKVRPTLRRGAELWLDTSESMQPYARDQLHLARTLRRLLGRGALRTRRFEVDAFLPPAEQLTWSDAEPNELAPGASVLVVSDFGCGRAAAGGPRPSLDALRPWVSRARDRDCPVLGLIPAARSYWPRALSELLLGFEWDRPLSARVVRAATRAGGARS